MAVYGRLFRLVVLSGIVLLSIALLALWLTDRKSWGSTEYRRVDDPTSQSDGPAANLPSDTDDVDTSDVTESFISLNGPKRSRLEVGNRKSIPALRSEGARAEDDKLPYPIGWRSIDPIEELPVDALLVPGLIPPEVHYLWCGKRWFEFKHYLSVMSVLRTVRPDKIFIHHEHQPERDHLFYNQWLDDIKFDYPWLHLVNLTRDQAVFCDSRDRRRRMDVIFKILDEFGGMFIGENTWLLDFPPVKRSIDFDLSLDSDTFDGYVLMRRGFYSMHNRGVDAVLQTAAAVINTSSSSSFGDGGGGGGGGEKRIRRSSCCRPHHIYHNENIRRTSPCVVVKGGIFDRFNPMDIWQLDDQFGRLTRRLFYGTEEIRVPVPKFDTLVPNIGHMVWMGGAKMDYVFYLSVLSLLFVAKVDTVYIHGDVEPAGELWQELMTLKQTKDRIKFITRSQPTQIFQGPIEPWFRALMSDIVRVDLMIKYGGIYTDTDAIWVKPLSKRDRGFDAVAAFDWVDWSWPFPDSVNFGISYGKKNAPFWRLFRESMRTLHNNIHGFTGVMNPYKLLEKYPTLLRIDPHLQVICYHSRCHPTWVQDYHNMNKDHINSHSIPNWRKDVNAFHWTHPNPRELTNRTVLLRSTGIFAEMGKNILLLANLL